VSQSFLVMVFAGEESSHQRGRCVSNYEPITGDKNQIGVFDAFVYNMSTSRGVINTVREFDGFKQ
jgi:hypothetical protein